MRMVLKLLKSRFKALDLEIRGHKRGFLSTWKHLALSKAPPCGAIFQESSCNDDI